MLNASAVLELGSYFTLAFHTAVFILTLYKTLASSRQAAAAGIKNSLFSVILRDGTFVFYSETFCYSD